jgi:hypothetical protein
MAVVGSTRPRNVPFTKAIAFDWPSVKMLPSSCIAPCIMGTCAAWPFWVRWTGLGNTVELLEESTTVRRWGKVLSIARHRKFRVGRRTYLSTPLSLGRWVHWKKREYSPLELASNKSTLHGPTVQYTQQQPQMFPKRRYLPEQSPPLDTLTTIERRR